MMPGDVSSDFGDFYLRTIEIGKDCLSLCGPWHGLVAYQGEWGGWGFSNIDAAELREHPALGSC